MLKKKKKKDIWQYTFVAKTFLFTIKTGEEITR